MSVIQVESLVHEPYASILCYPRSDSQVVKDRVRELTRLGVTALEFEGVRLAANVPVPVLGKGTSGVVVIAHMSDKRVALKIKRSDTDREGFEHEATMLRHANRIGIGPRFIALTGDMLLMQLVDGNTLFEWMSLEGSKHKYQPVISEILEQCWELDQYGFDHGELSNSTKHIMVDSDAKVFLIDFESSSMQRKVANVTSVCQYLFNGNSFVTKLLAEECVSMEKSELLALLKGYKHERTQHNFEVLRQFVTRHCALRGQQ